MVYSFTDFAFEKLPVFFLITRLISHLKCFAANGTHHICTERPKTNSSQSWGSLHITVHVLSLHTGLQLAASSTAFHTYPLRSSDWVWPLAHTFSNFTTSGKRIHRKKELPGSLDSWGEDVFVYPYGNHSEQWVEKSEISPSSYLYPSFSRWGWNGRALGIGWPLQSQKGNTSGWDRKEERQKGGVFCPADSVS